MATYSAVYGELVMKSNDAADLIRQTLCNAGFLIESAQRPDVYLWNADEAIEELESTPKTGYSINFGGDVLRNIGSMLDKLLSDYAQHVLHDLTAIRSTCYDGCFELREFRAGKMAVHRQALSVIMDVVDFSYTRKTMYEDGTYTKYEAKANTWLMYAEG